MTEEKRRYLDAHLDLIMERFDDLKQNNNVRFNDLAKKIDDKCLVCPIAEGMKHDFKNMWWHISKLWLAYTSGLAAIFAVIGAFFYLFWSPHRFGCRL